jgi:hypothetical protein
MIYSTYKCFAFSSKSNPGEVPSDTGIVPLSLLSVKSSRERLDILPMEGGIGPLKLLEARDLHRKKFGKLHTGIEEQILHTMYQRTRQMIFEVLSPGSVFY